MTTTAVIFNPTAGQGRSAAIASAVERGLLRRGLSVELVASRRPGDATRLATEYSCSKDIVVAVGGDGTVNEVANGLAGCATRLGIVPAGTANVLALELGLPFQVERACNVIAQGNTISMDLGTANGRRFVLMMGAGIDAMTVRYVDPVSKRRFRKLAFLTTGVRLGFSRPHAPFLVTTEDEEHVAIFAVVSNSRYYAGRFGVTPMADPTDGVLDTVLFTSRNRGSLALFWLGVPTGLHLHHPNMVYLRTTRVEMRPLKNDDTVWFQTDGELAGRLPAVVEIEQQALSVLVP